MTESDIKGDKVIFDIFELQILIDIRNLFSLCRQIAVKGKIIFERDAGFFLYVVILEINQKFVKKKKKKKKNKKQKKKKKKKKKQTNKQTSK